MRKIQVCPCVTLCTAPTCSCVFVCVVLSKTKNKQKRSYLAHSILLRLKEPAVTVIYYIAHGFISIPTIPNGDVASSGRRFPLPGAASFVEE